MPFQFTHHLMTVYLIEIYLSCMALKMPLEIFSREDTVFFLLFMALMILSAGQK